MGLQEEIRTLKDEKKALCDTIARLEFEDLEVFRLSEKLKEAKVEVTNIMMEKNEVLKALDSKTKDFVEVNLKNVKASSELSEIKKELNETKAALIKKHLEDKTTVPKIEQLQNIVKNLKSQNTQLREISESKFNELQNQIKAKDVQTDHLSIEIKRLLAAKDSSQVTNQNKQTESSSRYRISPTF